MGVIGRGVAWEQGRTCAAAEEVAQGIGQMGEFMGGLRAISWDGGAVGDSG